MREDLTLYYDCNKILRENNINAEVIEDAFIRDFKPIIHVDGFLDNKFETHYYITIKGKKNRPNIYFLYYYDQYGRVKHNWLLSTPSLSDIVKKLKDLMSEEV